MYIIFLTTLTPKFEGALYLRLVGVSFVGLIVFTHHQCIIMRRNVTWGYTFVSQLTFLLLVTVSVIFSETPNNET